MPLPQPPLPVTYTDAAHIFAAQPELAGIPDDVVQQAAGEAEAEINAYIAKIYTLPIGVFVPLLTTLATEIAVHKVFTSRSFSDPAKPVATAWKQRYDAAMDILRRLSTGEMVLVDVDGTVITPSIEGEIGGTAWSNTMRFTPTFGEGDDRGFFVDRNKLDFESGRRGY